MRVAYITRGAFGVIGGAASYMIPTLMSAEHDVLVLSPEGLTENEKVIYTNNAVNVVKLLATDIDELLLEIYLQLIEFRPDIVHIFHNPYCLDYLSNLPTLLKDVKWVLDFRSPLLINNKKARKRILMRYFLSQFYVDHIFTHSKLTLKDNIKFRVKPCSELTFGVELHKYKVKSSSYATPRRFVYIGSLSKGRKLNLLVRSFGEFVTENKKDLTLDIYGEGESLFELRAMVKSNDWPFISLHGGIKQEKLFDLLHNYDIGMAYVSNDKYSHAPSLKSAEYAAAGLPVFASDTEGHRDWDKRFGFKYKYFKNTSADIKKALSIKYAKDELLQQAKNNLQAVKHFDWNRVIKDDLCPIYNKLLN